MSDEVQVLSSLAKVLHFPGSYMKSLNGADPRTPERQMINFNKDTGGFDSDKVHQPKYDDSAKTTNSSEYSAFASLRMSTLFKKISTAKTGYYGPPTFLDIQEEFNDTFGIQPRMYHEFEQDKESHDERRKLKNSLMLVNLMFSFLYVRQTTLVLILPTPRSTSKMCVLRYISCVRYGSMVMSELSRTPLNICIKNI